MRVACNNGATVDAVDGEITSGQSSINSAAYLRTSSALACGPPDVDPHVTADAPARLLQPLQERPEASLKFRMEPLQPLDCILCAAFRLVAVTQTMTPVSSCVPPFSASDRQIPYSYTRVTIGSVGRSIEDCQNTVRTAAFVAVISAVKIG